MKKEVYYTARIKDYKGNIKYLNRCDTKTTFEGVTFIQAFYFVNKSDIKNITNIDDKKYDLNTLEIVEVELKVLNISMNVNSLSKKG